MSTDKSKQQLTKNLFSLTLVQVANYILPLISVPIYSRIIGPEKFGIINFSAAYIAYFNLIISYSFAFSATRKLIKDSDNEEYRNKVFSEVFSTQLLLFGISTIIFLVLLFTVEEFKENKVVILFSYLVCLANLFTQNWIFQAMQNLSRVALFNFISRLLFTVLVVLVVRENKDYIWQPFLIGATQTAVSIWAFSWAYRKYNLKFTRVPLSRCLRVLAEEKTIFFSLIFVNLYTTTNTVILGLYQNSEQVGYYTAAQRLIVIAQSVLTMPLSEAFYPFIGKAFGESREKGLMVTQKLIPLIIVYCGTASLFMYVLGPFAIQIFYGAKFEPAINVFQILAIVPLLFALNNILGVQIMLNLGMDKYFFKITASAGILSIILNFIFISRWGYVGTTFNWLTTEIFLFVSMYLILRRQKINPINFKYFSISQLIEYGEPIVNRILRRKSEQAVKPHID